MRYVTGYTGFDDGSVTSLAVRTANKYPERTRTAKKTFRTVSVNCRRVNETS
jgi:hypothetical protein